MCSMGYNRNCSRFFTGRGNTAIIDDMSPGRRRWDSGNEATLPELEDVDSVEEARMYGSDAW